MNISSLFSFSAASHRSNPHASSKSVQEVSPLALAVQRADQRIQAEVETNTAQLSSFGKLKSSVSEVQLAAHTLRDLPVTASPADITSALGTFVSAFNAAASTAHDTAKLPGALAASQSANRVANGLQRALAVEPVMPEALANLGVHVQEGRLALDLTQLASALAADPAGVQATLANIGQRVGQTASAELEANGNVSGPLTSLHQQAQVLGTQQSALQSAAQATASAPSPGRSGALGQGLAAYRSHINIG